MTGCRFYSSRLQRRAPVPCPVSIHLRRPRQIPPRHNCCFKLPPATLCPRRYTLRSGSTSSSGSPTDRRRSATSPPKPAYQKTGSVGCCGRSRPPESLPKLPRRRLRSRPAVPGDNTPHISKLIDLEMMVMPGGRERTEQEFAALFESAGFALTRVVPTESMPSVIEGRPI